LAKSLQLTIDGCRRLLKERNDPREVELVRQVLLTAESRLEEVKRQQKAK